jgi:opacity protein-like surface antigen
MKRLALVVGLLLLVSSCLAEDIKTFIIVQPVSDDQGVTQEGKLQYQVRQPTDEELNLANRLIDDKIRLLIRIDGGSFLGIKRDPSLLIFESKDPVDLDKEKTLGAPVAVAGAPEDANKMQDQFNGFNGFLRNSEFEIGLGPAFPLSPTLTQEFKTGFWVNLGYGYKLSNLVALNLDLEGGTLDSNNDSLTRDGYGFSPGIIALTAKVRFAPKGLRPYLFAGPGLALESYSGTYSNGNFTQTSTYSDAGFGIVGGAGLELQVEKVIYLYLQAEAFWSTTPSDVNGFIPMDNPFNILPIQFGVLFGR